VLGMYPVRISAGEMAYPMSTGTFSTGVKRSGREFDHSPLSSANLTTCEGYISTAT
jgi:hypothetical protein